MGQITNAILLEKGLRTEFVKAFNNGEDPSDVMKFILRTKSSSNQEKYGWLGEVPQLRLWDDVRQLDGLKDFNYTIPNKDYEATLKIDKNVMDDDQLGNVKVRIRDLALRARTHPRKLFFDQLILGDTELSYDGVTFFNASHLESGSAQSNIVTGTSSGPYTVAEFSADFESARARMRNFQDDQGEPRNEGNLELTVVGSPDIEPVVDKLLSADLINNTTNTLKGAAKKLITSRLSGEDWYLLESGGNLKPFIMQERKAIKFEMPTNTEREFMAKELLAGVDWRVGFGFGVWYKAIKVNA